MNVAIDAPISVGELMDKITILEIKLAHFSDAAKRANVAAELACLQAVAARHGLDEDPRLSELETALIAVNETLWKLEERIRRCEIDGSFGVDFVKLARAVYCTNDERARLKRRINDISGSALIEEKSYWTVSDRGTAGVQKPE